ncbi:MAG TPA: FecR domain-containing protein, partial [bacterium]|nr:FecR domain-containing protein [bacterium]
MKNTATGLCLGLALCLSLACSKKQADTEIPVGTPTPTTQAPGPAAPVTLPPRPAAFGPKTEMAFAMPSPTTTPQPLEYEVDDIQGTVLALFSGASAPETVAEGETLQSGDTLMTGSGSQATLTLNDVTAVQVSASTTVKVADLEPNATQGFTSRLQLAGGRVLSEVQKLTESHSTFEVEANGVVCGVRGTAFEVTDQDGQVDTDTFHGSVEVQRDKLIQLVAGGEHSSFSVKRRAFLAKRRLN